MAGSDGDDGGGAAGEGGGLGGAGGALRGGGAAGGRWGGGAPPPAKMPGSRPARPLSSGDAGSLHAVIPSRRHRPAMRSRSRPATMSEDSSGLDWLLIRSVLVRFS